ncbi:LysR family transcriptional regulator [Stutzerimonas stutzeri]|uniref:LysR family transcriptional regulator n=1 Tax=Stutzerimonas stutzeri TaxID=316 RepID=UPI00210ED181|nr:LysR family transcriptional regulator [Stutzerimonas stutzeri]MCQ4321637.1 LysR family transcriptional regulator [Stutzerimonas stutzeri]
MDVRKLRQFVVLAETLNFRKAAELLNISQPPLSVAIRKLEASFGAPLFERSTRQVRLTPAGEAALLDIRTALFHLDQAQRRALQTVEGMRGVLTIGSVASATLSLIPRLVPPFRQQFPGVELVLREYTTNRIVAEVEKGGLDIGLVRSPIVGRYEVSIMTVERDWLIAVVPADHPLADRTRVDLAELAGMPFVSYAQAESSGLHFAVTAACQAAGFLPRVVHETAQIQATISLVTAGLGVALVPALHGRRSGERVRFLELNDPPQTREIGLALVYNPENETNIARCFRDSTARLVLTAD